MRHRRDFIPPLLPPCVLQLPLSNLFSTNYFFKHVSSALALMEMKLLCNPFSYCMNFHQIIIISPACAPFKVNTKERNFQSIFPFALFLPRFFLRLQSLVGWCSFFLSLSLSRHEKMIIRNNSRLSGDGEKI